MVQILVPTADQAAGSWTATPLWSKVDDDSTVNPTGDGTVIVSDSVGNGVATTNADLKLAAGTDPAVSTGHTLRARWNHNVVGRSLQAFLELWQGIPGAGTLIATMQTAADVGSTEVETTLSLTGTQADAITDYTNLYIRVRGLGTGGGPPRALSVDLAELEIPDAGGGSIQRSFAGGITPAGAPVKTTRKPVAGTASPAGNLNHRIRKTLTAALATAGAAMQSKLFRITLTGTIGGGGSSATLLKETFPATGTDWTTAEGADNDWTTATANGADIDIAAGDGRMIIAATSNSWARAQAPVPARADTDILIEDLLITAATRYELKVILRGDGAYSTTSPNTGYMLRFRVEESNSTIEKFVGGVLTQLGATFDMPDPFPLASGAINLRMQVVDEGGNAVIRVRWWLVGQTEPATWNETRTDSTSPISTGIVALALHRATGTAETATIDTITIANPITIVGTPQVAGAANGADINLTPDGNPAEGDLYVLIGGTGDTDGPGTGDLGPVTAGFTEAALYDVNDGSPLAAGVWYKFQGPTPDTTVVCNGSGVPQEAGTYALLVVRGVDPTTPLDAIIVETGPTLGVTVDLDPITTATPGALVIAAAIDSNFTPPAGGPTGYANFAGGGADDTLPTSVALATRHVATPGAENPGSFSTWGNSGDTSYGFTIALRPATVGGGGSSLAAALLRKARLTRAGTATPAGSRTARASTHHEATLTPAGTAARRTRKTLAASLGLAGTVTNQVVELALQLAGALNTAGTLILRTLAARAGTTTPAGTVSRETRQTRAGTITPTGTATRRAAARMAGTVAPAAERTGRTLLRLAGTITPTGDHQGPAGALRSFAGALTASGALLLRTAHRLEATATPTGTRAATTHKAHTGAAGPIGSLRRAVTKRLAGTVNAAAARTGRTLHRLAGALTTAGSLTVQVNPSGFQILVGGTLTLAGARLARTAAALEGTATPNATLTKRTSQRRAATLAPSGHHGPQEARKALSALLAATGAVTRRSVGRRLAGTATPTGTTRRHTTRRFEGAATPTGTTTKRTRTTLQAALTLAGAVATDVFQVLAGPISRILHHQAREEGVHHQGTTGGDVHAQGRTTRSIDT